MPPENGTVRLVGAGPGAADLLTVRAARAIAEAEALVYDALVDEEVLALAPAACLRIQAGKRAGNASLSQDTINRLMLRLAQRGLRVVRLKGGDPSIFGRSGEEASFLQARGIEVDIVPGVTAASAAAAQFGVPLTHRGEARRLVFATARTDGGATVDAGWSTLADPQATLAVYMGRDRAGEVAERLIREGRSPATPALAVENAGRPSARAVRARLVDLGPAVEGAGFNGPVLLLVGDALRRSFTAESAPPGLAARAG